MEDNLNTIPNEADTNGEKIKKLETERDEYLNGWKRAKADLVNFQKDEGRRLEEILKFGLTETLKDFIPVLDSFAAFERALMSEPNAPGAGRDLAGMRLIRTQLLDILKRRGLEPIVVELGKAFDPAFHEAIGEVVSTHPPGTIAEEIEQGYAMHGRVIRAARVKLAK
ncbi:MAG: nucleotide exchange factor GrpE [Patescibacteria group bacterium]